MIIIKIWIIFQASPDFNNDDPIYILDKLDIPNQHLIYFVKMNTNDFSDIIDVKFHLQMKYKLSDCNLSGDVIKIKTNIIIECWAILEKKWWSYAYWFILKRFHQLTHSWARLVSRPYFKCGGDRKSQWFDSTWDAWNNDCI